MNSNTPEKLDKKISMILQVLSIYGLASVFFGFLIVNIYLAFFGYWDPEFLRVQYVSAGSLFLFMLGVPAFLYWIYFIVRNYFKKYRILKTGTYTKVWTSFAEVLILIGVSYFGFTLFKVLLAFGRMPLSPAGFMNVMIVFWLALIFGSLLVVSKSREELRKAKDVDTEFKKGFLYFGAYYKFIYFVIAAPILFGMFVWFIYPFVPRYFGGGQVSTVNIGLVSDFDPKQINVENPFPGFLVYQSSDSILVLTTKGEVYTLRKDDVAYIRYLDSNKTLESFKSSVTQDVATSTETVQ